MSDTSFIMAMPSGHQPLFFVVVVAPGASDRRSCERSAIDGRYLTDEANAEEQRASMIERMCQTA